jgi:hypothetical protein
MPSAAAVPMTVEISDDSIASMRVLRSAVNASGELKSSTYHFRLNPVKTAVLLELLNEKNISVNIGI